MKICRILKTTEQLKSITIHVTHNNASYKMFPKQRTQLICKFHSKSWNALSWNDATALLIIKKKSAMQMKLLRCEKYEIISKLVWDSCLKALERFFSSFYCKILFSSALWKLLTSILVMVKSCHEKAWTKPLKKIVRSPNFECNQFANYFHITIGKPFNFDLFAFTSDFHFPLKFYLEKGLETHEKSPQVHFTETQT